MRSQSSSSCSTDLSPSSTSASSSHAAGSTPSSPTPSAPLYSQSSPTSVRSDLVHATQSSSSSHSSALCADTSSLSGAGSSLSSLSSSSGCWLSYAGTSLSGLSMEQEDARQQRVEARRQAAAREREKDVPRAALPFLQPIPQALSHPSPTAPVRSSPPSSLPFERTPPRRLRPDAGSDTRPYAADGAHTRGWIGATGSTAAALQLSADATALRAGGEDALPSQSASASARRSMSERQRQQMSYTRRLSPTPMELPDEDDDSAEAQLSAHLEAAARGQSHRACPCSAPIHCDRSADSLDASPAPSLAVGSGSPSGRRPSTMRSALALLSPADSSSSLFAATPFPSASAPSTNPLSSAILYVHSLVSTSPAEVAGLRVRDFIIEIDGYSKSGWEVNHIERVAHTVLHWPDTHPGQPMRIVALRRLPQDHAAALPDVIWARTKANGGHESGNGNGNGGGAELIIALQRVVLWPLIGRWRLSEQQGGDGGGVLGAVLVNYPDPVPVPSPPRTPSPPHPPSFLPAIASPAVAPVRTFHPAVGGPVASRPLLLAPVRRPSSTAATAAQPAPPRYTSAHYPQQVGSHLRSGMGGRSIAASRDHRTAISVRPWARAGANTSERAELSSSASASHSSTSSASLSSPSASSHEGSLYRHF